MTAQPPRPLVSPILVGIAGHTKLRAEDVEALKQSVRAFLDELRTKYRHTPVRVLSSLAEGADQLGAEVAIELGIEVIALLPFPAPLYAARFETAVARENLARLTKHPLVQTFLPEGGGRSEQEFAAMIADAPRRKQRYDDVAKFLSSHSQVLVALVDYGPRPSLTSDLVKLKVNEGGFVLEIYAPRADATAPLDPSRRPGETTMLWRDQMEKPQAQFEEFCALTESLNIRLADQTRPAENDLLPDAARCSPALDDLAAFRRLVADASNRCGRIIDLCYGVVFALILAASIAFHFSGHSQEGQRINVPLLVSAALFAAAFILSRIANPRKIESRMLDYRAFAEALRVQFYWQLAGRSEPVSKEYLLRQFDEIMWIRESLRAWALQLRLETRSAVAAVPKQMIRDKWFTGQIRFYEDSYAENHAAHQRYRLRARWLLISAAVIGAVICSASIAELLKLPPIVQPGHSSFLVVGTLILAGATAHAYAEKRQFAEHARHFRAMKAVYIRALHEDLNDDLFVRIGKEAVNENAEWLVLHRVRHFEVPPPG